MIVLDENVFASQREYLLRRRVHLCQIGLDVGRKGIKDHEILPLLRELRRPTLITRDRDFFKKNLCSSMHCLVFVDVPPLEIGEFTRRFMRHKEFRTWSQRKDCVVRVARSGIAVWRRNASRLWRVRWTD